MSEKVLFALICTSALLLLAANFIILTENLCKQFGYKPGSEVIKGFSCSTEHEIYPANKC